MCRCCTSPPQRSCAQRRRSAGEDRSAASSQASTAGLADCIDGRLSRRRIRTLIAAGLLVGLTALGATVETQAEPTDIARQIDELLARFYRPDGTGAAVIATRDGETVFRRAYGLADIELGVPMRPEMVFQLGSISKQSTAMAVMLLTDSGRLSLDDEITTHLPDYPTHGHTITVRHLPTHTSGIRNHTAMQAWRLRDDLSTAQPIEIFRDEPL